MKNLLFYIARIVCILLFGILGFVLFQPDATPKVLAQTCATPAQVPNVQVSYPSCVGDQCNFTQAGCSWGAVTGASNYQVKATEVDTGTVVYNQTVAASVANVVFPITQKRTYKCDVSAVNSCGNVGIAGTHSLLCEADAAVTTTPIPTSPPVAPPLPPVGAFENTIIVALAVLSLLFIGGFLLL